LADDEFIDKLVKAIQDIKKDTGESAKNMKEASKESKGLLNFLTDEQRKFVKISKLATTNRKDASLKQKAFAQSWLAVRRISAKVSYEAYALQSTIMGGFDSLKAVSETARMIQDMGAKKAEVEEKIEKSKLETLIEQKNAAEELFKKEQKDRRAKLEEFQEMRDFLREKQKFAKRVEGRTMDYGGKEGVGKLSFEEVKQLEALEEQIKKIGGTIGGNKAQMAKRAAKFEAQIKEVKDKEENEANLTKFQKNQRKVVETWTNIFNKIKPAEMVKTIRNVGKMALSIIRAIGTIILVAVAFYLFAKQANLKEVLFAIWDALVAAWAGITRGYETLKEGVVLLIGGLMSIFDIVNRVLDGDFKAFRELLPALSDIFEGAVKIFLGIFGGLLEAAFLFISGFIGSYLERMQEQGRGILSSLLNLGIIISTIAAAIIFIASGMWLAVAATFLAGAIAAAVASAIPFANGGVVRNRGMQLVGERGPELVSLPVGSRVYSNTESRAMTGNTINVTVQGRVGASDAELREIAQKIGRMVNMEVNRTTASRTRGA
jgi:hypothetical protein